MISLLGVQGSWLGLCVEAGVGVQAVAAFRTCSPKSQQIFWLTPLVGAWMAVLPRTWLCWWE